MGESMIMIISVFSSKTIIHSFVVILYGNDGYSKMGNEMTMKWWTDSIYLGG